MYLLGYDIGSSSVKASIIDAQSGRCVASGHFPPTEAPIKSVRPGFAEQRPADWWNYLVEATRSVTGKSGIAPDTVAAIGISYQMHGLVALDKDRRTLRDAIIWCDSRGVTYGEQAADSAGHDRCLRRLLNLPGNFTATKLRWVMDHEPHIFEKIDKICLPGDYIAYRLTGELSTTTAGLSEMMLWDFATNSPAKFMMDILGIPARMLPPPAPTFGISGHLRPDAAMQLGLAEGIPVSYRAGDQPNNALSLGVTEPGQVAATAGTSGVVYGIAGKNVFDPLSRVNSFANVNHSADTSRIGVLLCVNGAGILNSWLKRNVAPSPMTYAEMNALAAEVAPGSEGLVAMPFGNGAERILDNRVPGCSFSGIDFTRHDRRHLFRAAQEGIVFSLVYGMEIMKSMGMDIKTIHAGNANMMLSPVFRETLASTSGAEIKLFATDGAAGAARGAGIGAGIYSSVAEAMSTLQHICTVRPADDRVPYLDAYRKWERALELRVKSLGRGLISWAFITHLFTIQI